MKTIKQLEKYLSKRENRLSLYRDAKKHLCFDFSKDITTPNLSYTKANCLCIAILRVVGKKTSALYIGDSLRFIKQFCPELSLFDNGESYFWGIESMGQGPSSNECMQARIMGLLLMIQIAKNPLYED